MTVVTVTVVIFVTVVIVTVATVAVGTVVIVTYFSKNNLTPRQQMRYSQGSFLQFSRCFCEITIKASPPMYGWLVGCNYGSGCPCVDNKDYCHPVRSMPPFTTERSWTFLLEAPACRVSEYQAEAAAWDLV